MAIELDLESLTDLQGAELEAFPIYCENMGEDITEDNINELVESFRDSFQGEWVSVEEYAENWLEDTGILDEVPEALKYYIDIKSYARDLQLGGDIWVSEVSYRRLFVFFSN